MKKNLYFTNFKTAVAACKERGHDGLNGFPGSSAETIRRLWTSVVLMILMMVVSGSAFAGVHFSQNYEAAGAVPDWTTSVSGRFTPIIVEEDGNHYLTVDQDQRANNGCILSSSSLIGKVPADVNELTMTFDLRLAPSNDQTPNEFTIADGGTGFVLKLVNKGVNSTIWQINDSTTQTVTMDVDKWYSYNIEILEGVVFVTVTEKSSGNVVLARQKVKNIIDKFGLGNMSFVTKRNNANIAIDNVKVSSKAVVKQWDFTKFSEKDLTLDTDNKIQSGNVARWNGSNFNRDLYLCTDTEAEGLYLDGDGPWKILSNSRGLYLSKKGDRPFAITGLSKDDVILIKLYDQAITDGVIPKIWGVNNSELLLLNSGSIYELIVASDGNVAVNLEKYSAVKSISVLREDKPVFVDFSNGENTGVAGTLPEGMEVQKGLSFLVPENTSLYKSGYTLAGWDNGTDTIACGGESSALVATTYVSVFKQNEVVRTDSKNPVSASFTDVKWTEPGTQDYYVTQTAFNGETQDVAAMVDGKTITLLDIIPGTKITFPAGTVGDYSATDVTVAENTWTYNGSATSLEITYSGSATSTSLIVTFPLTQKPVIRTDIHDVYAANLNAELPITVGAIQAETYQWYSNSVCSTEGGTIISGANSSTYNAPTTTKGNAYYYCIVGNSAGNVISNVARVRVDDYVTFDFTAMSEDDMNYTTDGIKGYSGVVQTLKDSLEWDCLPIISPYHMTGYFGVMTTEASIQTGKGFSNNNTRGDRTLIMYGLKQGDVVVIKGKSLTGGQIVQNEKNADYGRADVDSLLNTNGTDVEILVTMKTDGDLAYLLRRQNIQEIHSVMMPNKYRPTVTTDLDGETHTLARGETQTLTVAATAGDSNALTYQWYRSDANTIKGGLDVNLFGSQAIEGATSASYTTEANQSYYYFCVVYNSVTGAAAVTPHNTRIQCKPQVTYECTDPDVTGVLPPTEIVEIGGQHTVEQHNQLLYKDGYTLTEWTAEKLTDDSVWTYNFGESYYIVNDTKITPVFTKNEQTLKNIIKNVEQQWQFGTTNGAPAVAWTDSEEHPFVEQCVVSGETQDGAIFVTSTGFDNSTAAGEYVAVAAGTTIKIPVKYGTTVTLYAKEGETPSATFMARDLNRAVALTGDANVLTYQYYGGDSIATLTLSAGNYEKLHLKHIPSGMPVIQANLLDDYYTETGKEYTLTVDASDLCRYQWYKNTTKSNTGGTPITGATTKSLTVSRNTDGSEYYYMTVTNDHGTVATNCAQVNFQTYVIYDFTAWDWTDVETSYFAKEDYTMIRLPGGNIIQAFNYPYGLRGMIGCFAATLVPNEGKGGLYNGGGGGREVAIPNMKKGQHLTITGDVDCFKECAFLYKGLHDKNNRMSEEAGDTIPGAATYTYEKKDDNTRVEIDVLTDGAVVFYFNPRYHTIYTIRRPSLNTPVIKKNLDKEYVVEKNEEVTLTVQAELSAPIVGDSLTYQWFENTTNSNKGGTKIEGATDPSYTIDKVNANKFYYCLISNSATDATVATIPAAVGFYVTVKYVNNDVLATGECPKDQRVQGGLSIVMPVNQTLYKEGYTLTSWTDGKTSVNIGEEYTPANDVTLYPVFVENNADAALTARPEAMTTRWVFSTVNGSAEYNNNVSANVNQETINNYTIDLGVTMTKGDNQQHAEYNASGWMAANGADFTIPVVRNTKIYVDVYSTATGITIDGNALAYSAANGQTGNVEYVYTYTGAAGTITLNVGNNYIKQIIAEYPAPEILKADHAEYDVTITSDKVSRKSAVITLTGRNLVAGQEVSVEKVSNGSDITVSPETFTVADDGTVNQQILVTYSQTAVQADGAATLRFFYSNDVKPEVKVNYGRTVAFAGNTAVTPVTDKTVWDWSLADNDIVPVQDSYMSFSDVTLGENVEWPAGVNAANLAGSGRYFSHNTVKSFEGTELYFETTRKGTVEVEFSAAGNGNVTLAVNGENTTYSSSGTTKVVTGKIQVPAGGVLLQGREQGINSGEKMMRVYKITFIPDAETPIITLDKSTSSFTLSTTDMSLPDDDPDKETIYYTTDGTKPTRESYVYNGTPVSLATNVTIHAIAMATAKNNSDMAELVTDMTTYKLNVNLYPSDEEGRIEIIPASEDGTYTENATVTVRGYAKNGYGLLGWTTSRANIGTQTYCGTGSSMEVTINSTANDYWAVFATGPQGTVNYDFSGAIWLTTTGSLYVDDLAQSFLDKGYYATLEEAKAEAQEIVAEMYEEIEGNETFKTPITSTSISVPSNYPLHTMDGLDGGTYTLQYWQDAEENRYDLGTNTLFKPNQTSVTLYPVFKQNEDANFMEARNSGFNVTWDFRKAYGAHPMTLPSGVSGRYYSTHATMDYYARGSLQKDKTVDLAIKINTEGVEQTADAFTNEDLDEWATLKQGTKVTIPSSYGAKIIVATYAKMNADDGGTMINGKHPDNIHDENVPKTSDGAYLYTWTMGTDDQEVDLVIGNDYSYYKYINAVFKDAEKVYLKYYTNNDEDGTVTAKLDENEDYVAELTNLGYAYPKGSNVTLTATRNIYHRLLYWLDDKGAKIYPDGTYELANGNTGTISSGTVINGITYKGVTNETDMKYTVSFEMNKFYELQAVFGDMTTYYVNFSVGDGDGLALPLQHIEHGRQLIMPACNYNLYRDGYTLKYYVESGHEDGQHYEFGRSYNIDRDMRLKPVFEKNTKSIDDISDVNGVTATWDMSKMDFDFSNARGHIVAQLPIDENNTIDMRCYVEAKNASYFAYTNEGIGEFSQGAFLKVTTTKNSTVSVVAATGMPFEAKQIKIGGNETAAGATVSYGDNENEVNVTRDSTKIEFAKDSRISSFSVTFRKVSSDLALNSVTIGGVALSAEELLALKNTLNHSYSCEASTVYAADGVMPEVKATANEDGGETSVTQATVENNTAVILLKKGGVTIQAYNINFTLTGKTAPVVDTLKVNGIVAENGSVSTAQGVNGVITLVFDHAMKTKDVESGADDLNQTLDCVVSGRYMNLTYWNLNPNKSYTLTIPANTLEDIYGEKNASEISVSFTTGSSSSSVDKQMFNFVVTHKQNWDSRTQVTRDSIQIVSDEVISNLEKLNIKYGTLEYGIKLANSTEGSGRFYIFVPNGEYNMKGSSRLTAGELGKTAYGKDEDGNYSSSVMIDISQYENGEYYAGRSVITRGNVSIIGQSQDGTVIYNDPQVCGSTNSTDKPVFLSSTVRIDSDVENTYFQDLTIENRFCDSQSGSPTANIVNGGGAPAFYDNGMHTICKNVTMKAHEGTYSSRAWEGNGIAHAKVVHKTDNYYEDCAVWGSHWFIHDQGQAWFERPTIVLRYRENSATIAATEHFADSHPWGYVLHNGKVKAENSAAKNRQENKFYLASPMRQAPTVNFINMKFDVTPNAVGYSAYNTGATIRFHEYGSKNSTGNDLDLTRRSLSALSPAPGSEDCILSSEEAAEYTLRNALGGDNAYDPTIYTKQISMAGCNLRNTTTDLGDCVMRWNSVEGALCYFVFRVDKATGDTLFYTIASDASFKPSERQNGSYFIIRAANERGGLGEPSNAVMYKLLDSYQVTVKEVGPVTGKGWSTVCLPVNATFSESDDITVYAAITANNTTLGLKKITPADGLAKGYGYVIYAKAPATYTFKGTHNDPRPVQDGVFSILGGNPEDHAVSVGTLNLYTLAYKSEISSQIGFYKFVGSQIPARKAYLSVDDLKAKGFSVQDLGSKGMGMIFIDNEEIDEDVTDVQGVKEDNDDSDAIFDLSGKQVDGSQMREGQIYIINGEKRMK